MPAMRSTWKGAYSLAPRRAVTGARSTPSAPRRTRHRPRHRRRPHLAHRPTPLTIPADPLIALNSPTPAPTPTPHPRNTPARGPAESRHHHRQPRRRPRHHTADQPPPGPPPSAPSHQQHRPRRLDPLRPCHHHLPRPVRHHHRPPIDPNPTKDPARWGAWHRAQTVLGVATIAGHVRAASDTELRDLIAQQRAAEPHAPAYVAGKLRAAYTTWSPPKTDTGSFTSTSPTPKPPPPAPPTTTTRWCTPAPSTTQTTTHYTAATRVNNLRNQLRKTTADLPGQRSRSSSWNTNTRPDHLVPASPTHPVHRTRRRRRTRPTNPPRQHHRPGTSSTPPRTPPTKSAPSTTPGPVPRRTRTQRPRQRTAATQRRTTNLPFPGGDQPGTDLDQGPDLDL